MQAEYAQKLPDQRKHDSITFFCNCRHRASSVLHSFIRFSSRNDAAQIHFTLNDHCNDRLLIICFSQTALSKNASPLVIYRRISINLVTHFQQNTALSFLIPFYYPSKFSAIPEHHIRVLFINFLPGFQADFLHLSSSPVSDRTLFIYLKVK